MYEDHLPSFLISLVLFLAATIGFHVWLIWLRPASDVFWKMVDYLWVGFAAFAILTAVSQVRALIAGEILSQTGAAWNQLTTTQVENSKAMRGVLCTPNTPEKSEGCSWYDHAIEAMVGAGQSPDAWSKLSFLPVDKLRADFKQEAEIKISIIAGVKAEASRRLKVEAAAARQETIATVPLIASLFLLPIAFGLRLTKVTAEVKRAKGSSSK